MAKLKIFLASAITVIILFACSSTDIDESYEYQAYDRPVKDPPSFSNNQPINFDRYLWETWDLGFDLNNQKISKAIILQGDEAIKNNNRISALKAFKVALNQPLSQNEFEATVARVAANELAQGYYNQGLQTVANYFIQLGKGVGDANYAFSILLSFLYGASKDYSQSLAWFSKSYLIKNDPVIAKSVQTLLKTLTREELLSLKNEWQADALINQLVNNEINERSYSEEIQSTWAAILPIRVSVNNSFMQTGLGRSTKRYVALLPFTGRYASLAEKIYSGIQLAAEEHGFVDLVKEDTFGNEIQAETIAKKYQNEKNELYILGPVEAASSTTVAKNLSTNPKITLISFSKNATLPATHNVFQFAPTPRQQVNSLFSEVSQKLKVRKLGLIYPQVPSSIEYVKSVKELANKYGLNIAYEMAYYPSNPSDIIRVASEIDYYNLEAIFFPDDLRVFANFYSALSEKQRNNLVILGTAKWAETGDLMLYRNILQRAVFVDPFFKASKRREVQEFINKYQLRFQNTPDFFAAEGYDLMKMLLRSESSGFKSIRNFAGVSSIIDINDYSIQRKFEVVELGAAGIQALGNRESPLYTINGSDQAVIND